MLDNVIDKVSEEIIKRVDGLDNKKPDDQSKEIDNIVTLMNGLNTLTKTRIDEMDKLRKFEADQAFKVKTFEAEQAFKVKTFDESEAFKMKIHKDEMSLKSRELDIRLEDVYVKREVEEKTAVHREAELIANKVEAAKKEEALRRNDLIKSILGNGTQLIIPAVGGIMTMRLYEQIVPVVLEFETNNSVSGFISKQLLTLPKVFGKR